MTRLSWLVSAILLAALISVCGGSSPAPAAINVDPKTLVLQANDYPRPSSPDTTPLSADALFSSTGALAGAQPIDKFAETVDLEVPTSFQLNRIASAVAIYSTMADAAAVHVGKSFVQYEVPVTSKLGDAVRKSTYVGQCKNGSTCVYLEQITWRYRNVVGYVSWQYLSSAQNGIPTGATDSADQEAWGMAERMQTYIRLAAR